MDPRLILRPLSNGSLILNRNDTNGGGRLLPLPLNLIALIISYVRTHDLPYRNPLD